MEVNAKAPNAKEILTEFRLANYQKLPTFEGSVNNTMSKYIIPLLILSCTRLIAQDSLVRLGDLTFSSQLEQRVLTDYFMKKSASHFQLLMAAGAAHNAETVQASEDQFYQHLASLEAGINKEKRSDKKTKVIYNDIHKTFLKKYEEKNLFKSIFPHGNYNCVSASALYALAFERLNIPYVIKELPTHVYLIAYPEKEQIKIETTSPVGGVQVISPSFKQGFVKLMADQKLISAQEFHSQDVNSLFDKTFFGEDRDISLTELAGIQYVNDALYNYDEGKFEQAYQQIEKGYLLFPSERTGYLLYAMGGAALESHKTRDSVHAKYVSKLSRYEKFGVTKDMVTAEFSNAIQELLFEKNKKEQLDIYYNILIREIDNPDIKNEISFLYAFEHGRLLYNQARYKEALAHFEKTLTLKPDHADATAAFTTALAQYLTIQNNNPEIIKTLENYGTKYTQLLENNIYNTMLATTYLIQFGMDYTLEKPSEGSKYKSLFEEQLKKFPDLAIQSSLIGRAYAAAATYYFRRGQTTKARSIIDKGLQYSPNNQELLIRREMIR